MSVVTTVVDGGGGAGKGEEGSARLDAGEGVRMCCRDWPWPGDGVTDWDRGHGCTGSRLCNTKSTTTLPWLRTMHGPLAAATAVLEPPSARSRLTCERRKLYFGSRNRRASRSCISTVKFILSSLLLSFSAQIRYASRFWPCCRLFGPLGARFVFGIRAISKPELNLGKTSFITAFIV